MSLDERINEITDHCEWAKNTIEDKVTFNLPKEQAEISRERRAHGALVDACKLIKELKQTNTELQAKLDKAVEALEFYADINNWGTKDNHASYTNFVMPDLGEGDFYAGETEDSRVAGKKARETLKELGVE